MTTPTTDAGARTTPGNDRPSPALRAFRWLTGLLAASVLVQAVSAGQFLAGAAAWRAVHREAVFFAILWLAVGQVVAAVVVQRRGARRARRLVAAATTSLVLVLVQVQLGFTGTVAVHVPLGVTILAGNVLLASFADRLAPGTPAVSPRRDT